VCVCVCVQTVCASCQVDILVGIHARLSDDVMWDNLDASQSLPLYIYVCVCMYR